MPKNEQPASRVIDLIIIALTHLDGIATIQEIKEYFKQKGWGQRDQISPNLHSDSSKEHDSKVYSLDRGLWGLVHQQDDRKPIIFYRVIDSDYLLKSSETPSKFLFPCFTLSPVKSVLVTGKDITVDDGYHTGFDLTYFPKKDEKINVGEVKLLKHGQKPGEKLTRSFPQVFARLTRDFCSLGQSDDYYQFFIQNDDKILFEKVLSALRDVTYDSTIRQEFANEEGFSKSLLRFSSARTNNDLGWKKISLSEKLSDDNLKFTFKCRLSERKSDETITENDRKTHRIDFDFKPSIPYLTDGSLKF